MFAVAELFAPTAGDEEVEAVRAHSFATGEAKAAVQEASRFLADPSAECFENGVRAVEILLGAHGLPKDHVPSAIGVLDDLAKAKPDSATEVAGVKRRLEQQERSMDVVQIKIARLEAQRSSTGGTGDAGLPIILEAGNGSWGRFYMASTADIKNIVRWALSKGIISEREFTSSDEFIAAEAIETVITICKKLLTDGAQDAPPELVMKAFEEQHFNIFNTPAVPMEHC